MGLHMTPSKYPYTNIRGQSKIDVEHYEQGTFILS